MNTRHLIAIALVAVAGSAMAQEATVDTTPFTSTLSREAVRADVLKARAAGQLDTKEAEFVAVPSTQASGLSREAVRAETRAAIARGDVSRINAQAASYLPVQRTGLSALNAVTPVAGTRG